MLEHGFIQIYTGDGKGKTTASLGLALRAIGHGWKVKIIQFTKGEIPNYYGELNSSSFLPNLSIEQFGTNQIPYRDKLDKEEFVQAAKAYASAFHAIKSGEYQLVILDEINIAIDLGLLEVKFIKEMILNRPEHVEIVLTGRRAHPELISIAHLVTEMKPICHYFDIGVQARRGIEY